MQKNFQDFSMADMLQKADTPEVRQLLAMLRSSNSTALEQAAKKAQAGDYEDAAKLLQSALSSPQAQKLLKEMGDQHGRTG